MSFVIAIPLIFALNIVVWCFLVPLYENWRYKRVVLGEDSDTLVARVNAEIYSKIYEEDRRIKEGEYWLNQDRIDRKAHFELHGNLDSFKSRFDWDAYYNRKP